MMGIVHGTTLLAVALFLTLVRAGTTCATDQVDWYTNTIGETPCMTYQRLRQLCDSRYTVGTLRTSTPGDNCDSQQHACCCNSVAWNLAMLCFECQNAGSSESQPNAIDAGTGAYQMYLEGCAPAVNGLPSEVQAGVCNAQIDIRANLYRLYWSDGPWFYTFFRQDMQTFLSANPGKNLTNCAQSSPTTAAAPSPSTGTQPSTQPGNTQGSSPPPSSVGQTSAPTATNAPQSGSSSSSTSGSSGSGSGSTTLSTIAGAQNTSAPNAVSPVNGGASATDSQLADTSPSSSAVNGNAVQRTSSNTGAIAGGAAGALAALVALLAGLFCWRKHRRAVPASASADLDRKPSMAYAYAAAAPGSASHESLAQSTAQYGSSAGSGFGSESRSGSGSSRARPLSMGTVATMRTEAPPAYDYGRAPPVPPLPPMGEMGYGYGYGAMSDADSSEAGSSSARPLPQVPAWREDRKEAFV